MTFVRITLYLVTASTVMGCASSPAPTNHYPSSPGDVSLYSTVTDDGCTLFVATVESLERSPAWDPGIDELPLKVADAVTVAKAHFIAAHPGIEGAAVRSIELKPALCCGAPPGRWYYSIDFSPTVGGQAVFRRSNPVVVLLDGSLAKELRDNCQ